MARSAGCSTFGGDIDVLKSGIAKLLSGVETAFVTSLVGIGCAIVYSVAHHALIKSFRERVARLSARLDKLFPRQTAEDLLAKTLAEQQLHTAALQKLGDAIDKFTSGGADKVGEVFTQKVGSQMDTFSAALNDFTEAIDKKLIDALRVHAEQTQTSADNFNKVVDANRGILEQMRQMLRSSADFLQAVDKSGTSLNQSADALLRANGQLLTKLPELTTQMNNLPDANEFTRDNLNELPAQIEMLRRLDEDSSAYEDIFPTAASTLIQAVDPKSREIFCRWLCEKDLEVFFKLVADTSNDRQWRYREEFWRKYLPRISNTWIFLGKKARIEAAKLSNLNHGSLTGEAGNQSVLVFQVGRYIFS